jgi:hypothetical protein
MYKRLDATVRIPLAPADHGPAAAGSSGPLCQWHWHEPVRRRGARPGARLGGRETQARALRLASLRAVPAASWRAPGAAPSLLASAQCPSQRPAGAAHWQAAGVPVTHGIRTSPGNLKSTVRGMAAPVAVCLPRSGRDPDRPKPAPQPPE